jgi:para-aminobenzoate synthetase component I
MQLIGTIPVSNPDVIKRKLIEFSGNFEAGIVFDSHRSYYGNIKQLYHKYPLLAGFCSTLSPGNAITDFTDLEKINSRTQDWYMGYLGYDLKNEFERLHSENPDLLGWPPLLFFKPEILFIAQEDSISVLGDDSRTSFRSILNFFARPLPQEDNTVRLPEMRPRVSKEEYLEKVAAIKAHIRRGDIYEMNYCIEFFNYADIDPYLTFLRLNRYSPSPFAVFLKYGNNYLLSLSPERFLRKEKDLILSQPIKGTSPRDQDELQDKKNKLLLESSLKERTENIMITDLVRNDLSKIARRDEVWVDELCGIYKYPHVYQMISTVSARLDDLNFAEIIRATFPMGSMTGAPKIKSMQLIEEFEAVKRGLYSGATGYISPGMDFDLNVVIRSLQYNAYNKYLSYIAGSAITDLSDPEKEYEECLLKAYAINPQLKESEHD